MAFWNRNKSNTDVPAEIQEYYQNEKRQHTGIAWLLALGTLIVTIVLAVAIFFAGRWVWQQFSGDDNTSQVAQNDDQSEQSGQEGADQAENQDGSDNQAQGNEGQEPADDTQGQVDDEAAVTETPSDEQPEGREPADDNRSVAGTQSDDTPATGDQEVAQTGDNIPNTGPADTFAIFVAVTMFAYLAHRIYTSKATK